MKLRLKERKNFGLKKTRRFHSSGGLINFDNKQVLRSYCSAVSCKCCILRARCYETLRAKAMVKILDEILWHQWQFSGQHNWLKIKRSWVQFQKCFKRTSQRTSSNKRIFPFLNMGLPKSFLQKLFTNYHSIETFPHLRQKAIRSSFVYQVRLDA